MAAVFCRRLFTRPDGLGAQDWDQHFVFYASVLKSVIEYGQPPFWNPWQCGGNVLWQNPQVPLVSPVYPLAAFMPLALAMKLNIVFHYWIGLIGTHLLLTRGIGVRFLPLALFLSALYVFSGAFALHLAVGHSVFLPAFYLPWLLWFFIRALRDGLVRDTLVGAGVVALAIYTGGFHVLPMAVVAIGGLAIVTAAAARSWRPIACAVIVFAAGAALAAPKLLPVLLFVNGDRFLDTRTPTVHPDAMSVEMLWRAYLDRFQALADMYPGQRHGWWEFGNYIGVPGILAIGAGIAVILFRRRDPERHIGLGLALTSLVLLVWSAGEFSAVAPATLLARLPGFSEMRAPSRNTIGFLLLAVAAAGVACRQFHERLSDRRLAALAALVCALASVHLIAVNSRHFARTFVDDPLDRSFRWLGGPSTVVSDAESSAWAPHSPMLHAVMDDRVFFNCYESLQLRRTAFPDLPMVASADVTISDVVVSPNRVTFTASGGSGPARVFVNQNFDRGWSSPDGPVGMDARSEAMMLTLGPGARGTVRLSFVPRGLAAGVAVLVAAVAAGRWMWARELPA